MLVTVSTRYSFRMKDVVVLAMTAGEAAPQFRDGIWTVVSGVADTSGADDEKSRAAARIWTWTEKTILAVLFI